jgi:histone deacetylase complex regulatory component SIN3
MDRVSTLFSGNPSLIQGFNPFLPPGYRIECSQDPSDTKITITTLYGTGFAMGPPGSKMAQELAQHAEGE